MAQKIGALTRRWRDWQFLWWNLKTYGFRKFWRVWREQRATRKAVNAFYRFQRLLERMPAGDPLRSKDVLTIEITRERLAEIRAWGRAHGATTNEMIFEGLERVMASE